MKLREHFDAFLEETVNLNQARIDDLGEHVEAVKEFLTGSGYEAPIRSFSAQGSWAHKTIIRPVDDKEFDADLVVYVDPVDEWSPRDYVLDLRQVFRDSDRYSKNSFLKTRCVTIDYAGDFHLDVVPVVVEVEFPANAGTYSVCNCKDDEFEPTDGDGYTEWWREQDAVTSGHLKKVTRLLKYLRDVKETFAVKSVLLTTLLGERVSSIEPNEFTDLPTTLKVIIGALDDWLQEHDEMPDVNNPVLDEESFTREWTQSQYDKFRNKIGDYSAWIDDAYDEPGRDESIRKWRRVFGDGFAQGEAAARATAVVAHLAALFQRGQDLVSVVARHGQAVLQRMPRMLPHVQPSPHPFANRQLPVRIIAKEKRSKGGAAQRDLDNGELIDAKSGIEFRAIQHNGLPFPKDYRVRWQVVNTDRAAAADNGLRGGFYCSDPHGYRYEATKYRGVHWVQAFLVNKRTGFVDGVSDRFFVVIR